MGRSRSRSRSPDGGGESSSRRRRRSRSRERRRRRDRSRSRERRRREEERPPGARSRSPRSRSRSRSRDRGGKSWDKERDKARKKRGGEQIAMPGGSSAVEGQEMTEKDFEGKSPEEIEMMKVMGFGNFDTTKGKKVRGNDVGDVHVVLKRKYRQYMNRKGGFNRPLDFVH